MVQDITHRKSAEEVLANMSHEIRTPHAETGQITATVFRRGGVGGLLLQFHDKPKSGAFLTSVREYARAVLEPDKGVSVGAATRLRLNGTKAVFGLVGFLAGVPSRSSGVSREKVKFCLGG
jgi:hypothetical protein